MSPRSLPETFGFSSTRFPPAEPHSGWDEMECVLILSWRKNMQKKRLAVSCLSFLPLPFIPFPFSSLPCRPPRAGPGRAGPGGVFFSRRESFVPGGICRCRRFSQELEQEPGSEWVPEPGSAAGEGMRAGRTGRARAGHRQGTGRAWGGHRQGRQGTGRAGRAQTGHRQLPPLPHGIVPPPPRRRGRAGAQPRSPWRGLPAPRPLRPLQLMDNSVTQHEVRVGGTHTPGSPETRGLLADLTPAFPHAVIHP